MNDQRKRDCSKTGGLPKLTIVIPAYNCAQFIKNAVRSAICCNPGCILVSDDGSADGTLYVARESAANYAGRIHFHQNRVNMGMTAHWQQAMSTATTEYALKLDGDDEVIPEYVEKAYEVLETAPDIGIVGGRAHLIDADGKRISHADNIIHEHEQGKTFLLSGPRAQEFLLNWYPYPASSSTVYRMHMWRSIGGFNPLFRWCADREIYCRMVEKYSMGFINSYGAEYRIHDQSVTRLHKDNDLFVYELDLLYDVMLRISRTTQLRKHIAIKYLRNGLSFFSSGKRAVLSGRAIELPNRTYAGAKSWIKAIAAISGY